MKLRVTNVATVILWQGKDGEPGLDVSNSQNTCFLNNRCWWSPSSGMATMLPFTSHIAECGAYIAVPIDRSINFTSTCMR